MWSRPIRATAHFILNGRREPSSDSPRNSADTGKNLACTYCTTHGMESCVVRSPSLQGMTPAQPLVAAAHQRSEQCSRRLTLGTCLPLARVQQRASSAAPIPRSGRAPPHSCVPSAHSGAFEHNRRCYVRMPTSKRPNAGGI